MPIKLQKLPAAMRWGLAVLCAAVCGVLWAYYWRVFFGLDNRVSPLVVTLGCAAFLEVCLLAGYCVRQFTKGFAAKGAVCIFLCGLLFAFANPPLQTPDEADHYLRTYAISTGIKKTSTFTMGIILVLITLVVVLNLIRSRAGRAISAIRDNEIAAKSIGINITRYKLMAFVLSSVFAGMAGVLYSLNYSSLVAKKFDYNTSINILVFVVLGGIGSIRGSVIAAALLTVLPEMLRGLNDYRMLIYAIVLIVMMIFTRSPKLVAWRKEVAEKITEKFPILKLNKFLKDKSKKEAA